MGCSLFIRLLNLPTGNCLPGCSLFIRIPNLPPGDRQQGVQPVFTCSKPTSRLHLWPTGPCSYILQNRKLNAQAAPQEDRSLEVGSKAV